MYKIVIAFAFCLMTATSAIAGPAEDAAQVLQQWAKAFADSDVDGIARLYAPGALFFGTGSKTLVTTPEGVRKYFEGLREDMPRGAAFGEYSTQVLSPTVVLFTGLDRLSRTRDGKAIGNAGRFTIIVAKSDAGWRIVHFHRSALPG